MRETEPQVVFANNTCRELADFLSHADYDRLFLLCDTTTRRLCLPLLEDCAPLKEAQVIAIEPTDSNKNIPTLTSVWTALEQGGATRHSLLLNLGGGMVTDLGGFAAATFKRGIRYVNIPTTLLSMVDAAVGGKTGVNFNGLKNEIGAFFNSLAVFVDTGFLRTLDAQNLCSGYAEMLKHALLKNEAMWARHVGFDLQVPDYALLQELVAESISVKTDIVRQDPRESGLRKALNLGHTVGHAFESLALEQRRPILHGYAVAFGLVGELFLSVTKEGFPVERMRQAVGFVKEHYGRYDFGCRDYERLCDFMRHDKKNTAGVVNFTLLANVGEIRLDCHATKEEIFEMLDFVREC